MINLAIVGGRDFKDYTTFEKHVDDYLQEIGIIQSSNDNITIVSGGAAGADSMAEVYARKHNIKTTIFKPDWDKYGKRAGLLRNTDIVEASTHVLAFPTAKSKGTYDSINKARKQNKILKVINV